MSEAINTKAKWVWYPGDFEISLFNKCMAERYERDVQITPFWRMDSHFVTVRYYLNFSLPERDVIKIKADGTYNIFIENFGYVKNFKGYIELDKGDYAVQILVNNVAKLPCLYVDGKYFKSGKDDITVSCQDNGYYKAASWIFDDENNSPNDFSLPLCSRECESVKQINGGLFYDFGKEITAKLHFSFVNSDVYCYYGESPEEALDSEYSEQTDIIKKCDGECVTPNKKAFRYLFTKSAEPYGKLTVLEEKPDVPKCSFKCKDELLQRIFDTSVYTFGLCKKEFIIDGAKRDRWAWSGDTYQSALVNYYSYFDADAVKRTLVALKGKEPVNSYINHIMDYTSYWILSVYDLFRYTGDKEFVKEMLPWIKKYVCLLESRCDKDGFLTYHEGDWVFIDWAEMDNMGETSFEQIIFAEALKNYAEMLELCGFDGGEYFKKSALLWKKTVEVFYKNGAFIHGRKNGVLSDKVTKYANIFAILYGFADKKMTQEIVENVLINDHIQPIITPYMKFYELSALAKVGMFSEVLSEIKSYWGGMLELGATTFWEQYDPAAKGAEHYEMYDRKYGKSLCHAWGASPIYLIFACIFGIKPTKNGFILAPSLVMVDDFELTCPVKGGFLTLIKTSEQFTVYSDGVDGLLDFSYSPGYGEKAVKIIAGKKYVFRNKF